MSELTTIVDENDVIIGSKPRKLLLHTDIYRVACLWVENSKDEVLLAKRALTKLHHPGVWGPGVAGTVEYNDSYDDTMYREAFEGLGIIDVTFEKIIKKLWKADYYHFTQYYKVVLDYDLSQFVVQQDEVAEIKWFSKDELRRLLVDSPEMFLPSIASLLEIYR